jgi:hypothetical protein
MRRCGSRDNDISHWVERPRWTSWMWCLPGMEIAQGKRKKRVPGQGLNDRKAEVGQ